MKITDSNEYNYNILDGTGALVHDSRLSYFTLPKGINIPLEMKDDYLKVIDSADDKVSKVNIVGKTTKNEYEITKIIRRSATGNVYQGLDLTNQKPIIMKED